MQSLSEYEIRRLQRQAWRVREFCEAVRISRSHLYSLMKRGEIRTVTLGGRRLIPDSERARLLGEAA
jgi:excisionase family DNA binding protein